MTNFNNNLTASVV